LLALAAVALSVKNSALELDEGKTPPNGVPKFPSGSLMVLPVFELV